MEPIPEPSDNLWDFLAKKNLAIVVMMINLLLKMKVSLPTTSNGTGKFLVSEEGIVLDLTKANFAGNSSSAKFPLKIIPHTDLSGNISVKILNGKVAGRIADPTMNPDLDWDSGTLGIAIWYFYVDVSMTYVSPLWITTACGIVKANTLPTSSATDMYIEIGHLVIEGDGSGGTRIRAGTFHQELQGSIGVARDGYDVTYADSTYPAS